MAVCLITINLTGVADFKKLSSEYISQHKYFTARRDSYETSDGRTVDPYFVVELPTSAAAVAVTEDGQMILVKQYRYAVDEELIEIPGGFIDPGELPMQAVERELLEETGYTFSSVHYLANTTANPGLLNNYTHLFLALGGKKVADQSLDHNEEIEVILKPVEEVRTMLHHNEIKQSMHALCLFYAFNFIDTNEISFQK